MRRVDFRVKPGMVLLEAVVALTILAVGGVSAVALAAASLAAIDRAGRAERANERASQFLDAVSLWTPADFDRHLGNRQEGPWMLSIGRPTPMLYVVSLRDTATSRTIFTTSIFRPEAPHAMP